MLNDLIKHLDTISPLLVLLFIILKGVQEWRGFIFLFIIIQVILNGISGYIEECDTCTNNQPAYHLNSILSFGIISFYFKDILNSVRARKLIIVLGIAILSFYAFSTSYLESFFLFPSYTYAFVSTAIALYCFLYYLENILRHKTVKIVKSRDFWHVTGLFTYFTTSFFIFVSYRHLTESSVANQAILWKIHNFVFLIMCVYLIIGYSCRPSPKK